MSDTPPARKRMTKAERREQLQIVARDLFALRGYANTSIDEIAAAAGVSKPVVYEHFTDKETLYEEVIAAELECMFEIVGSHLAEWAPVSPYTVALLPLMEDVILEIFDYIEDNPSGWKLLTHRSPSGLSTGEYSTVATHFSNALSEFFVPHFLTGGLDPETAQIYAEMFIGAVTFVGLWWLRTHEFSKEEVVAHVVNLLYRGLRDAQRDPRLSRRS